ncbi:MAG: hypothetical protein WBD72_09735 [Candidatus Acidiferrum sp.]
MKNVKNIIGAPQEAEERGEQREAHVHRLKQVEEQQRQSDIERVGDEADGVIRKKMGPANKDLGSRLDDPAERNSYKKNRNLTALVHAMRHRKSYRRRHQPRDPGSKNEPGAPSAS